MKKRLRRVNVWHQQQWFEHLQSHFNVRSVILIWKLLPQLGSIVDVVFGRGTTSENIIVKRKISHSIAIIVSYPNTTRSRSWKYCWIGSAAAGLLLSPNKLSTKDTSDPWNGNETSNYQLYPRPCYHLINSLTCFSSSPAADANSLNKAQFSELKSEFTLNLRYWNTLAKATAGSMVSTGRWGSLWVRNITSMLW